MKITDSWNGHSYKEVESAIKQKFSETDELISCKQDKLADGESIKTINGIPVLGKGNINIPRGHDAVSPFKGWYPDKAALEAAIGNPKVGDYAYVFGEDIPENVYIWQCRAEGIWINSNRLVDTSNTGTFESGEALNQVSIVNDISQGGETNVLSAEQGKRINEKVDESIVSISEHKSIEEDTKIIGYYIDNTTNKWKQSNSYNRNKCSFFSSLIERGSNIYIKAGDNVAAFVALMQTAQPGEEGDMPCFIDNGGYRTIIRIEQGNEIVIKTPVNCYLYVTVRKEGSLWDFTPQECSMLEISKGRFGSGENIEQVDIVNDVTTGGDNNVLSAEQGKNLNEKIIEIGTEISDYKALTKETIVSEKYIRHNDGTWGYGGKSFFTTMLHKGDVIKIKSQDQHSAYIALLQDNIAGDVGNAANFIDNDEYNHIILIDAGQEILVIVPVDCYLYATVKRNGYTVDFSPKECLIRSYLKPFLLSLLNRFDVSPNTIRPQLVYETISRNTGDFAPSTFLLKKQLSTPRFVKIPNDKSVCYKSSLDCILIVYEYDDNFNYLAYKEIELHKGIEHADTMTYESCRYAKFSLKKEPSPESDIPMSVLEITGLFDENWDVYNPIPALNDATEPYNSHRIAVMVNATNPNCCDNNGYTAQDNENPYEDFGVVALPPTYSNTGDPTRLIIYCHGGAVNYGSSSVKFNSIDIDPKYWLSEGYAIMDVDGNPFDHDNEHFNIPQSMDCYVAGYQWVIEHYNIRTDGVFLGGRSMGGGMTFNLLRAQCPIPVIAACANVPHGMCIGGTIPYNPVEGIHGTNNTRQEFYFNHCGFDGIDKVNRNEKYYVGEIDDPHSKKYLLYHNWDKLVKNTPIFSLCTDLPTDDETKRAIVENFFVDSPGYYRSERVNLWGRLHAMARCPVKLFGSYEDVSCPPADTSLLYYRMLINAAQIAEVRLFPLTDWKDEHDDYEGHHYDLENGYFRETVVTRYGEEMSNVPTVYIEMLAFWRRYEQNN